MTDRKGALTELLAKVEAGDGHVWGHILAKQALGGCYTNDANELVEPTVWASRAFHYGSLDAAKALHEAVLTGISQYSITTDPTVGKASVCWWPDGISQEKQFYGECWFQENPARAWLIAILKALIAGENTNDNNKGED
jgi:hypothetical protein